MIVYTLYDVQIQNYSETYEMEEYIFSLKHEQNV